LVLLPIFVVLAIVAAGRAAARAIGFAVLALSAIFNGAARAVDGTAVFLRRCHAAATGIARVAVRALAVLPKAAAIIGAVFIVGALVRSALTPPPLQVTAAPASVSQASEPRSNIGMRSATWAGAAMSVPADVPTAYRGTNQTALPPAASTNLPARTSTSGPSHAPSRGLRLQISF
jgi:hypothetical protein